MAEFHNTKRIAIINKAGSGKSTLARYLIEEEITGPNGWWIEGIWTNGEIYSGDMTKGLVDVELLDGEVKLLNKEDSDSVVLNGKGKKIWYPKRYKSRDRPEGIQLYKISHMKQLERAKNGIQYLDEMMKCLPARRSGSEYNLLYGTMMSNIRHISCHFVGTDQYRKGADVFIRTNIDMLLVPISPMPKGDNPLEYWVYDQITDTSFDFLANPPNPLQQALEPTLVPAKHIWNLFRTTDIPQLTYDIPFAVQQYAEEMLAWDLPVSNKKLLNVVREFSIRDSALTSYLMMYEELNKKHLSNNQRRALIAYLDSVGILKKWSPPTKKEKKE